MACATGGFDTGIPNPFGGGTFVITSDVANLLLNWYLADRLLDAQEYYEDQMDAVANDSLVAAEELFEAHKLERSKDEAIFSFMCDQPKYEYCDTSCRAMTDVKRQVSSSLREAMRGVPRCDNGLRHELIMSAVGSYIVDSGSAGATACIQEDTIADEYLSNHYDAITGSALGSAPNIQGGFGGAASTWTFLAEGAGANAAGFVAGVGYFGRRAFSQFSEGSVTNNYNFDVGGNAGGAPLGIGF